MRLFKFSFLMMALIACTGKKAEEKTASSNSQIIAPEESGVSIIGEQFETDTLKGSLKAKAMGSIAGVGITINYYSPAVRGRVIWGGLVPFDNVWVTGAHRATNIEFNGDVVIGGVKIAAGKYGLFTIPGKEEWTFIINKNWDQHLADNYDQKDDIVRVKSKPEAEKKSQERLRYVIESESNSGGELVVYWEKLEISLPISISK